MLALLLGWLPILGPIVQAVTSIFSKIQDKEIVQIKADAEVTKVETESSTQIIHDTADNIGIRFARDLLIYPTIIWVDLIVWDKIVVLEHPNLVFSVADLPTSIAYLPFAVATFLLGNIGINMFNRLRR